MLQRFLKNHVLANIFFILVIIVGGISYSLMPRQQDPTVNFNWIQITTIFPGASAEDVEKRITDPIEDAISSVQDIRFVNSSSREGISSILVRFNEISDRKFDKRVADLRREIQNKERELPAEVDSPNVLEITTSNGFPTALVVVSGVAYDENLRTQTRYVRKTLERLPGISRVDAFGFSEPEIHIDLIPDKLQALGVDPTQVADTVRANFRDVAAGNIDVGEQNWLIRLIGTNDDPNYLSQLPILTPNGEIKLGSVATITSGQEDPDQLVSYNGKPGILLQIIKSEESSTLDLVDRVNTFIDSRRRFESSTGVDVTLVDDQTQMTRSALNVMQTNAILGLLFVLLVTFIFLGFRIALFISIAIPFILCGTFWVLYSMGHTLNVVVLVGIVISLGMLVDDAVVVVEAIYYRLQRGASAFDASLKGLKEVFSPVTTSVLTTMAAFLPLMLLPGIVGKFMFVVPFVVTLALAISLIEAYWMLPAHIIASKMTLSKPSKSQLRRVKFLHMIRMKYTRLLIKTMRYPKRLLSIVGVLFVLAMLATPLINFDFFAADPLRIFYVNVQMPPGTPLKATLDKTVEIEQFVKDNLIDAEVRSVVTYSGLMLTDTEPLFGDDYGQIVVSLNANSSGMRSISEMIEHMREPVMSVPGPKNVSFLRIAGGPPTTSPISIKVRGDSFDDIRLGAQALADLMSTIEGVKDITIDDAPGQQELVLRLRHSAIQSAALTPAQVTRIVRLYTDGEIVASMQHEGEELNVRVRTEQETFNSINDVLRKPVPISGGRSIPLGELVYVETNTGYNRIRHFNLRRSIEVNADINKELTDTVTANQQILTAWDNIAQQHPNVDLDQSGILDDIVESLNAMAQLMLLGLLLIYMIIGTQFKSYFQPFLIIFTVVLAAIGVIIGLLISQAPVSLYTLYGVIALIGISVNASIVLISAANERLNAGMSVLHATIYAARRRVIPIIITSLTTIAGLSSLAMGLGGYSLIWGPMAASIVWGLACASILTLFVIPVLYEFFMSFTERRRNKRGAIPA